MGVGVVFVPAPGVWPGQLPVTTSDHFVVEAPAVVQPGGETVDFIVGVEGSRFYTAYNMEIALPEDLVFVPNDKGNCAMMCGLEGMYPYDDSMGFPQFTHIFASGLQGTATCVWLVSHL